MGLTAEELKMYDFFKAALRQELPGAISAAIRVQSNIERLSELSRPKDAAKALGVAPSKISKWFADGLLKKHYEPDSSRAKVKKTELKNILDKIDYI